MDTSQLSQERVRREEKEEALSCPRCSSKDTKFCYYNNYSLTQPRYLCKACRRYWTHGGSLRSIPIGGSSRKIKRSSASSSKKPLLPHKRPLKSITQKHDEVKAQDFGVSQDEEVKDFSQGFGTPRLSEFLQLPTINDTSLVSSSSSAMELQGISNSSTSSNPPNSTFMAFPNFHHHSLYPAASSGTGFALSYDFLRPPLGFSLDETLNLQEGSKGSHASSIRQETHLFPLESLKFPASSTSTNSGGRAHEEEEEEAEQTAGFWTGMLADGNVSWQ